ncbi:MAG: primosomal protein N', partial [Gammaproteobacteria bacterium]
MQNKALHHPAGGPILRVAVPVPLRRSFDYLAPARSAELSLRPGSRLRVPFGKSRHMVGMLIGTDAGSDLPGERIKSITSIIDAEPLIPAAHLRFLLWASDYYQHPVGEVLFGALPARLRRGLPPRKSTRRIWRLAPGAALSKGVARRAIRQESVLA